MASIAYSLEDVLLPLPGTDAIIPSYLTDYYEVFFLLLLLSLVAPLLLVLDSFFLAPSHCCLFHEGHLSKDHL